MIRTLVYGLVTVCLSLTPVLCSAADAGAQAILVSGQPASSLPFNLTFTISGVSPTQLDVLLAQQNTDASLSSEFQIQFPQVVPTTTSALSFSASQAAASEFPLYAQLQGLQQVGAPDPQGNYTIAYTFEILETTSNFYEQKMVGQSALDVSASFTPPGGPTIGTLGIELPLMNYVIQASPAFDKDVAVVGANQTLVVNWSTAPELVPVIPSAIGMRAPNGVVVYAIDLDADSLPASLPCNRWGGVATASTSLVLNADTPVAGGCTFTPSTNDGNVCVTFPDASSATNPDYLDYSAMSANWSSIPGLVPPVYQSYRSGAAALSGLVNGHHYAVFLQFMPKGTQLSQCVVGVPVPNFPLPPLPGVNARSGRAD